jgi:GAG-pre-integrase domain
VTLETPYGPLAMTNVLFVPSLATIVMSGLTALDRGFSWSGQGDTVQLTKNGCICMVAKRHNGLRAVDGSLSVTGARCYAVATDAELWHRRLAHPADGVLNRTLASHPNKDLPKLDGSHSRDCDACLRAQSSPVNLSRLALHVLGCPQSSCTRTS